jgi:hypothetical protein
MTKKRPPARKSPPRAAATKNADSSNEIGELVEFIEDLFNDRGVHLRIGVCVAFELILRAAVYSYGHETECGESTRMGIVDSLRRCATLIEEGRMSPLHRAELHPTVQ